jgi:hypothetical protein
MGASTVDRNQNGRTMHQIVVESSLSQALGGLAGQAVICDTDGRALGFFSPLADRPLLQNLQLEPLLSIAETEELRKVCEGKPLEEILDRLGIT